MKLRTFLDDILLKRHDCRFIQLNEQTVNALPAFQEYPSSFTLGLLVMLAIILGLVPMPRLPNDASKVITVIHHMMGPEWGADRALFYKMWLRRRKFRSLRRCCSSAPFRLSFLKVCYCHVFLPNILYYYFWPNKMSGLEVQFVFRLRRSRKFAPFNIISYGLSAPLRTKVATAALSTHSACR